MKNGARTTLSLPGASGRELWSCEGEGVWKKQVDESGGEGCILAIEALALDSMPIWAVAPEDGKVDVQAVAALRWEAQGLSDEEEGCSWMQWSGGDDSHRLLLASAGLSSEAPVAGWIKQRPQRFEISPRLFPIPPGELAVWQELGRYVVAVMRSDKLVHFMVLSERVLGESAALEIRDLIWSLETQEWITKLKGARIWTACEPEFEAGLRQHLGTRVHVEEKPAPVLPETVCGISPPAIERERKDRAARKKKAQLILALAAMYVLFFAAWAGFLGWREHQVGLAFAALEVKRPLAEAVRQSQAHWLALEPATNRDTYPTEVFDRLVKLLPDQGIQFKAFSVTQSKVSFDGEASSISHEKKLETDVQTTDSLRHIKWNFGQPTILDDGRARFTVDGVINETGGESVEGE